MVTRPSILQVLLYDQAIGTLAHLPGDKHLFAFDDRYIRDQNRPTLSLSFKDVIGDLITHVKITQSQLPPFFSNLLPEGAFRDYLAKQANINPLHEFSLLQALGKDLPGALTVQTLDSNDMLVQPEFKQRGSKNATLRFSLAGVQLKFSALEKANHRFVIPSSGIGGKWIVKLPHSTFRGVPENEYTMMELARKVGIDVPKIALCSMEELGDLPKEFKHLGNHFFAIERFDRTNGEKKIHIEDFAQVFGVYPEKKY